MISGTERALMGERIILNISILREGISKILLSLNNSLRLVNTFNYELDKKSYNKRNLLFEVSKFDFKNHLVLGLILEKNDQEANIASVEIKALDVEEKIKEMSIFDIEILKPEIHIEISTGDKPENFNFKLEKKNAEISTFFKGLEISAVEINTKKPVKVEIIHFSEEEYIDNLDKIPVIFDIDNAIKDIIIHSNSTIELEAYACYFDQLNNEYNSNKSTIIMKPLQDLDEEEFTTSPIFNTIGFETPQLAVASS